MKVFSKIDLAKVYNQIPVLVEDIPKTTIITPFSKFQRLRMSSGSRNGSQTL